MSQKDLVKEHFSELKRLTREYAWNVYGIKRLGAIIHELKSEGYVFDTVDEDEDFAYILREEGEVLPQKVAVKSKKKYKFGGF